MSFENEAAPRLSRALEAYRRTRARSKEIARPITPEDAQIQSMPDASPTKWHLAHTTWFFETFLLGGEPSYRPLDPRFKVLYNSYYNAIGAQHPRPERGLVSRPSLSEVMEFRDHVDAAMIRLVERTPEEKAPEIAALVELGVNHEQQHQELMLTDILHAFSSNPLRPAYAERELADSPPSPPMRWLDYGGGIHRIGYQGGGFSFDNEGPPHEVLMRSFRLGSRLVTCGEYLAFMADGGYGRPELWLSDGWNLVSEEGWEAPLYWEREGGAWRRMSLYGMKPVDENEPVCHVSYYEADAYARWAQCRLPTEAEWEVAAASAAVEGNLRESGFLLPRGVNGGAGAAECPAQLFGDVWEWTASSYAPYPGFRPGGGAIGEYNGKFMCNQFVLRGGSCLTPRDHVRATYRNFFPPQARWQFTGIRLAHDA